MLTHDSVLPGGNPTATPLLQLPTQQASGSYTWSVMLRQAFDSLSDKAAIYRNVNLPAGTSITLQVRDGTGALNYASPGKSRILPGMTRLTALFFVQ